MVPGCGGPLGQRGDRVAGRVGHQHRPARCPVQLGGHRVADGGQHLPRVPGVRREQPLAGGEPHPGQVMDRGLDPVVVALAQNRDRVGLAVGGAGGAVGDRGGGDLRVDRRQCPGQRAGHIGKVARRQPVEQHGDDRRRLQQRHPAAVDDGCGLRVLGPHGQLLAGGQLRVHHRGRPVHHPAALGVRRLDQLQLGQVAPDPAGPEIPAHVDRRGGPLGGLPDLARLGDQPDRLQLRTRGSQHLGGRGGVVGERGGARIVARPTRR